MVPESSRENSNPIEKLCYIGNKALGALEYKPTLEKGTSSVVDLDNMQGLLQKFYFLIFIFLYADILSLNISARNVFETVFLSSKIDSLTAS